MDRRAFLLSVCNAANLFVPVSLLRAGVEQQPRHIGSRRELFVDDYVIDRLNGAVLRLHSPQQREIVLRFDRPWEGKYSGYVTVLHDPETKRFLAYYRGMPRARHDAATEVTCVATSSDGVCWERPTVGRFEVLGTKDNNVVMARHSVCHNMAPFYDRNPACPADQRFKAIGGTRGGGGLYALASADGLRWRFLSDRPVFTEGAFDSQNVAFWSESEGCYVCYFRVSREGKRWIARTTSEDFLRWSRPVDLGLDGKPRVHFYTNQFAPYPRAPHIYLGLPTRFFPGRRVISQQEARALGTSTDFGDFGRDCTDIVLVSTRGGAELKRSFREAFIRPGLDPRNWTSRANYAARGFLQTGPHELSIYVLHHYAYPSIHLRRYSLRLDGFVSVYAPLAGGELVTKPLRFRGNRLLLNYSTSAAGGLRVELQRADGRPIPGFTLAECAEIIGDRIDAAVRWRSGQRLGQLAGQPVRIRFVLRDADVFSFRFA